MKIHPPVKNYKNQDYPKGDVTQWFGENYDLYFPRLGMDGHNGIDIVRPHGEELYAVEDGIVADAKYSPDGYGRHVRILSEGTKSEWTYGHLDKVFVMVGQVVKAGQFIGTMGNTGFVVSSQNAGGFWNYNPYAGTHLHLGRREIKFTKNGWRYNDLSPAFQVLNYNNGFFGAVDFADMLRAEEEPIEEEFNGVKKSVLLSALQSLLKAINFK
jgi:murein DD-endopeptidase MepM/ murein hydrolase activator NlpD